MGSPKKRPEIGLSEALVRPTKGLICTSYVHTVKGAIGEKEDLTIGHEAVGVVEETGEEVELSDRGDRIAVGAITPDWGYDAGQRGHPSQSNQPLGKWKYANVKDNVFAELAHVNDADANMAHIPREVDDEKAVYVTESGEKNLISILSILKKLF